MSRIEELTAQAVAAASLAEEQTATLRQLERQLEGDAATNLTCTEYMALSSRTAQQRQRSRLAEEKSRNLQHEVDVLRECEFRRLEIDQAEKHLKGLQAELTATRAGIEQRRPAILNLQIELSQLETKSSLLLAAIDKARQTLAHLQKREEVLQ
jgi:chromosome segregation ATPase